MCLAHSYFHAKTPKYKEVVPTTLTRFSAPSGGNLAYKGTDIAPVCAVCIETLSQNYGVADILSICVRSQAYTCFFSVAKNTE